MFDVTALESLESLESLEHLRTANPDCAKTPPEIGKAGSVAHLQEDIIGPSKASDSFYSQDLSATPHQLKSATIKLLTKWSAQTSETVSNKSTTDFSVLEKASSQSSRSLYPRDLQDHPDTLSGKHKFSYLDLPVDAEVVGKRAKMENNVFVKDTSQSEHLLPEDIKESYAVTSDNFQDLLKKALGNNAIMKVAKVVIVKKPDDSIKRYVFAKCSDGLFHGQFGEKIPEHLRPAGRPRVNSSCCTAGEIIFKPDKTDSGRYKIGVATGNTQGFEASESPMKIAMKEWYAEFPDHFLPSFDPDKNVKGYLKKKK